MTIPLISSDDKPAIAMTCDDITVSSGIDWLSFSFPDGRQPTRRTNSTFEMADLGKRLVSWLSGSDQISTRAGYGDRAPFCITYERGTVTFEAGGYRHPLGTIDSNNLLLSDLRDWLCYVTGQPDGGDADHDELRLVRFRAYGTDCHLFIERDSCVPRSVAFDVAAAREFGRMLVRAATGSALRPLAVTDGTLRLRAYNRSWHVLELLRDDCIVASALLSPVSLVKLARTIAGHRG